MSEKAFCWRCSFVWLLWVCFALLLVVGYGAALLQWGFWTLVASMGLILGAGFTYVGFNSTERRAGEGKP